LIAARAKTISNHPARSPIERLAILELRAAHGWPQAQTAERMLVTPATISSCISRVSMK